MTKNLLLQQVTSNCARKARGQLRIGLTTVLEMEESGKGEKLPQLEAAEKLAYFHAVGKR